MDCLIIGFNDSNFENYVEMTKSISMDAGAYRDLNLAFIEYNNKPYRALDIFTHFQSQDGVSKPFHNTDFLWPTITYLGTYLHKRGFSFDYVNLFHFEKEKLKDKLIKNDILTVAITTTLYVSPHPIIEIVSFIREYNKKVKIIVGGHYISTQAEMWDHVEFLQQFRYIGADIYVINSEGEYALVKILEALKSGTDMAHIDNIAYKNGDNYVLTSRSIEDNPLEENRVDYSLFPKADIGEFVSLRTAKSCPFSCAFCGFPQRAGKYKYINVDLIEKELNTIRDIGTVTTLTFLDDTFNVPKKRFKDILRMMIKNQYGFKWNSFYRCDHGDDETILLMKEAGCEGVFLGVESGSDTLIQKMNKKARRKDYQRAIPLFKQAGIITHANLVIGFPGETYETIQETLSLMEETKPDFFRPQLWYCDPMTPAWQKKDEYGIKGSAFNWSHNTMNSKTATDLIDEMFLSIDEPIWLPQNGFELWSVFYLQRKGMTMSQVKTFIKSFNAIIRDQLIHPEKKCVEPDLLECLKQSCRFDDSVTPVNGAVEALSGYHYRAARTFWLNEFSQKSPVSNIDIAHDGTETMVDEWIHASDLVEVSVLNRVASEYPFDMSIIVLAAYSVLLSRLNGREDTVIVVKVDEKKCIPLKLSVCWNMTFKKFLTYVAQKLTQSLEHGLYAFHLLKNPPRMMSNDFQPPVLDVGYEFYVSASKNRLHQQSVSREIKLILEAIDDKNTVSLQFLYGRDCFHGDAIQKLSFYLTSILKDIGENPEITIEEIVLERDTIEPQMAIEDDASEIFHFGE